MNAKEYNKMIEDDYPKHPEALVIAVVFGFILLIVGSCWLGITIANWIFG